MYEHQQVAKTLARAFNSWAVMIVLRILCEGIHAVSSPLSAVYALRTVYTSL